MDPAPSGGWMSTGTQPRWGAYMTAVSELIKVSLCVPGRWGGDGEKEGKVAFPNVSLLHNLPHPGDAKRQNGVSSIEHHIAQSAHRVDANRSSRRRAPAHFLTTSPEFSSFQIHEMPLAARISDRPGANPSKSHFRRTQTKVRLGNVSSKRQRR